MLYDIVFYFEYFYEIQFKLLHMNIFKSMVLGLFQIESSNLCIKSHLCIGLVRYKVSSVLGTRLKESSGLDLTQLSIGL